jgi:hypothetical protein
VPPIQLRKIGTTLKKTQVILGDILYDNEKTHLYKAQGVYKQVFRLQVAIHNVKGVQVLKGQNNLRSVEAGVKFTVGTPTHHD